MDYKGYMTLKLLDDECMADFYNDPNSYADTMVEN